MWLERSMSKGLYHGPCRTQSKKNTINHYLQNKKQNDQNVYNLISINHNQNPSQREKQRKAKKINNNQLHVMNQIRWQLFLELSKDNEF